MCRPPLKSQGILVFFYIYIALEELAAGCRMSGGRFPQVLKGYMGSQTTYLYAHDEMF